jgi:hypothetical protein
MQEKKNLNKIKLFLLLLIFFFFGSFFTANLLAREELRILTASRDGVYFNAAKEMKEILKPNFKLIISSSSGSFYNIQKLGNGQAELAFAQSDALYLYITLGKSIANRCLVVAPVQFEFIHVLVKRKSDIETIKDLKNKKIAVGRKFSGSWVSSYLIMHSENDTKFENNPNVLTIPLEEATERLLRDEVDAIFVTIIKGAPVLKDFFSKYGDRIKLLSLGNDFSFSQLLVNRYYSIRNIKKGTYEGQDQEVYTAATPSFLLAYKYLNSKLVKNLTRDIYENSEKLKQMSNIWDLLEIDLAKKQIKSFIPYHNGAKSYIQSH